MFVVTVNFAVKPALMAAFLPKMKENAATSLRDEAGCHQFDVCTDPARPDEVFLYEVYTDAAAFDAHLATAHFRSFDAAVRDMIATKVVVTYGEVQQ